MQPAGRVDHVADVLQGEVAVGQPRRDHGLGHHADQQDPLAGQRPDQVEEAVEQVAAEDVAGHVLGRRHPLQRGVREQLAGQQRVGQLEPERVGQVRVDLEGVPQPELPVGQAGLLGEVLVQQLADGHRVRGLDRVGGREVVVLAGVDDDPGPGVHLAGEPLVDEGADRVDVAEEDPVHRVVEHHVEPLEPGQRRDLRHAQPGGVVGQPDVAAQLLRRPRPGRPASAGSSPGWRRCRRSPRGWRPRARSRAATARWTGSPRSRRRPRERPPGPAGCPRRCRRWPRSGRSTACGGSPRRWTSRSRSRRLRSILRDARRRPPVVAARRAALGVAALGHPERHRSGGRLLGQGQRVARRRRPDAGRPRPGARRRARARRRRGQRRRAG